MGVNDQNLITLYQNDTSMLIAQILLSLYVMSIIPLFAHAFRKSVNELIYARRQRKNKKVQNSIKIINQSDSFADNVTDDDEERVNDQDIIEDAVMNSHLVYYPV